MSCYTNIVYKLHTLLLLDASLSYSGSKINGSGKFSYHCHKIKLKSKCCTDPIHLFYCFYCCRDQINDTFIHSFEFTELSFYCCNVDICEDIDLTDTFLNCTFEVVVCKSGSTMKNKRYIYSICNCMNTFKIKFWRKFLIILKLKQIKLLLYTL